MRSIRKLCIGLVLLTAFFFTGGGAAFGQEDMEYIRVGLKSVSLDYTAELSSEDGFGIYQYENGKVSQLQAFSQLTQARLSVTAQGMSLLDPSGEVLYTASQGQTIALGPGDMENTIWQVGGSKYRGAMMFLGGSSSVMMINVMPFEAYLYGVVPREMSASYPLEALKAQAVAARSFAALSGTTHKSSGYDVCTSTHCQVYGGVSCEAPSCTQAVEETAGVYARVEGEPVACYYSANNGGYIDDCRDVWGSDISYLKAKADPYNPEYTWVEGLSAGELEQKLTQQGKSVGSVTGVEIVSKAESGCVTKLRITGTQGSVEFEREKIRTFLGVPSQKFIISATDNGDGSESAQQPGQIFMTDGRENCNQAALSGLYALSAQGSAAALSGTGIYGAGLGAASLLGGQSFGATQAEGFTSITLTGYGNGHGLGMSQQGANEMAKQGADYEEILQFYYTGIEVY